MVRALWRHPGGKCSPIDLSQTIFVVVVASSFLTVLMEYRDVGVGVSDFLAEPLRWYFAPRLAAFPGDRFVVLRHTLVFSEAALWWFALRAPGLGIRLRDLESALFAGVLACAVIGVAQSVWHFAPGPMPGHGNPLLFRITSTWPDNNTLAAYLGLLLPQSICLAWRGRYRHVWLASTGLLLAFAITSAASRSGWVGTFASGVVAAGLYWKNPERLGLAASPRRQRLALFACLGAVALAGASLAVVTSLDLRRDIDHSRAASVGDVALMALNLRRPANDILADRVVYWRRGVALWRERLLLGIGIGRFSLWKLNPPGGIVAAGAGGNDSGIGVGAKLDRWVNASGMVNFEHLDALAGDTIESTTGGWGPIPVE